MKKRYSLLPISFLILLLSCSNPKQTTIPPYFDLQGYVNGQIKTLTANKTGVLKKLSVNDKKEEHQINTLDWQQELQPFIDADINKPSWRGNFTVDTTYTVNTDTEKIVTYTTEVKDIRTKSLVVHFNTHSGEVIEIEAHNLTDNILYHFDQLLYYFPLQKYFITTGEKVVLMNPTNMKIDGNIVSK